ncbi:carbohydrate ABC transporter permease, partial [Candidatus Poribacteria bacterium]|nr:carbohydrate ABC transporter permease [Candidatus Poribacteria bacterium]
VPLASLRLEKVKQGDYSITRMVPDPGVEPFMVNPREIPRNTIHRVEARNYIKAWFRPEEATRGAVNFGQYFWVSVFTGVVSTIGTLITSAFAAFAFAKMNFWGKGAFFYIVLLTMMVPGQVLLIPDFLILGALGWLDTYLALIVPFLASVFTIFLMRQFFMTIPDDLWDAAQIDGAGRFRFLWQVVAPLSKPVFITAGIFVFLGTWNSLLWPLIVTSRPEMRTLMVGLQAFNEEAGSEFELLMAASSMAIVPVVILFFLLQRFFIQGIARTGLK